MSKQEETPTPFDVTKRVTLYSTDKDPHHVTGTEMNVGILVAEKLLKNGLATDKAPKKEGGK